MKKGNIFKTMISLALIACLLPMGSVSAQDGLTASDPDVTVEETNPSDENDTKKFANQIEGMIKNQFELEIPVFVILREALEDILHNAPEWWGNDNKEIYDNLIFIMPPAKFSDVYDEIGEPKKELEKIADYKDVIFWSFSRKDYQKTNWWSKTANANIGSKLTIRTANTVRKLVDM